jgi:hypothetical protein
MHRNTAGTLFMDVDAIRSRFIQENLRRALQERDRERAARALQAFRTYFQWFEDRLPAPEKYTIVRQLNRLAETYADSSSDEHPSEPSQPSAQ